MFKNMLKRLLQLLFIALVVLVAWLYTPDTSWEKMRDKYATAESEFVTLENGLRLHYRDTGNSAGKAIVLIHGTSDSLLTWDRISPLLQNDYRLIAMDLPGHGLSSQHPERDYSKQGFSNSVQLLMDHLGIDSATLVGNSLGGNIAWRTAALAPGKVDALVLLDPSGSPPVVNKKSNIGFRLMRTSIGRQLGKIFTPRTLIEKSLIGTVYDPLLVNDALTDRYWEMLRLPGNRDTLTALALVQWDQQAWENIGQIATPSLIIWGAEDHITPTKNAAVFNSAMSNSQLLIYPEVGHLPMIEVPEKTAADIRSFLEEL
ncbi:MAG: alpha/beta hydrolase [Pseudomonadota bacterium]